MDWLDILMLIVLVATFPIWIGPAVYLAAMAFAVVFLACAAFASGLIIVAAVIAAPFVWAARLCGIRKVSVKCGDLDRPRVYRKGTWRIK